MTNRLATNSTQSIIWRWEGEAFGNTPAQELTGISVNLMFPGQYYDAETNLHYNWNRYYDPSIGRYITSDPIGIKGGINTYAYVNQNPIRLMDLLELTTTCPSSPPGNNDPNWEPEMGSWSFHCSYRIYKEKRKPCPDDPRVECVYNDEGNLVNDNHPDWQC